MDNTFITYKGNKGPTECNTMRCYYTGDSEIHIEVQTKAHTTPTSIRLNELTAVRLSKELRKEIALLKDSKGGGSDNG